MNRRPSRGWNSRGSALSRGAATRASDPPPTSAAGLAEWLLDGVLVELEALERDGGEQRYELLTGTRVATVGPGEGIYQFIIADGMRLPEDAEGRLRSLGREFRASVVSQEANRIQVLVEGDLPLPDGFQQAILEIDDTALLRKLAEVLEAARDSPESIRPLAVSAFHPGPQHAGTADVPAAPELVGIESELRALLQRALGSALTYLWGPPGTGKTYTIARLIAALVLRGERVLLTSHTHAAIDKALYETVSREAGGPLAEHPYVGEGKVLRIGRSSDPKVPDAVRLDKVVEAQAVELQAELERLESQAQPLNRDRATCRAQLGRWKRVADLETEAQKHHAAVASAEVEAQRLARAMTDLDAQDASASEDLEAAQHAWWARARRVREAELRQRELAGARTHLLSQLTQVRESSEASSALLRVVLGVLREELGNLAGLPPREPLETALVRLEEALRDIESRVDAIQQELSGLQQRIIDGARVVCCTLTKNYVGQELSGQEFDAVIVDEVSMALPPLLFLAANRATIRIVLVGDFLQLPPVVRSDSDVSDARLKTDIFHLAGVAEGIRPVIDSPVLARLTTQRRMAPDIADAARHLAYGPDGIHDHESVLTRPPPAWLGFLPDSSLVVVDTADLHCWSGKQPQSLSRFNFYTATLAVELAAMGAGNLPEPSVLEAPPIGIVAPYAAQRRLLVRLTRDMNLTSWVLAGTVHTFQGSEAPLVIFDCVLDEPYWSSMLTNPAAMEEVVRQLNVGVTRARDKFVFLGSSEWLNTHAKPGSGLGLLWDFLRDRADLVAASELVEDGFMQRVSNAVPSSSWSVPQSAVGPVHEVLDEATFFPRFQEDLRAATESVFGLVPFFGEYRWPQVQPFIMDALSRGVDVTLVVPPASEASNAAYVSKAIAQLREAGAIVITGSGLHGKDVVIDERMHYTGSLNWASHRGRREVMHRTSSPALAKLVTQYLQARYIRAAAVHEQGEPRVCPVCGGPTQVVNQRRQHGTWDRQAMKVGCANPACQKYLRNIDERPPFRAAPVCDRDGRTRKRRVARGKGEVWKCPKHPKECRQEKVVPGDPA